MERKKLIIIISIIIALVGVIIGVSYSWFGSFNKNTVNNAAINITTVTPGNGVFNTSSGTMLLNVTDSVMFESNGDADAPAVTNNTSINVTLTSANPDINLSCLYDIVFEYDSGSSVYGVSPTVKTSGAGNELSVKLNGPDTGISHFAFEDNMDISSGNTVTLLTDAYITTNTSEVHTWNFDFNFYNLPLDQTALANKTFKGKIHASNVRCSADDYKTINGTNLANYIVTNYASLNGTDAVSNSSWSVVHQMIDSTIDAGYRYIGKNPDNYVLFNDELWRIIGVENVETCNDISCENTSNQNLVKITRNDSIGSMPYDSKNANVGSSTNNLNYGSNDWSDAQIMMLLNPATYYKSANYNSNNLIKSKYFLRYIFLDNNIYDSNSIIIYKNMGSYFDENMIPYKPASTSTIGFASGVEVTKCSSSITSDCMKALSNKSKLMISSVKWYLYGGDIDNPKNMYKIERNINGLGQIYNLARPISWYGKVGLIYPSDFGFATAADGTETNRNTCLETSMGSFSTCGNNDWLSYVDYTSTDKSNGKSKWTITSKADDYQVYYASSMFSPSVSNTNASMSFDITPSLYLKQDTVFTSGTGTWNDPYVIK